MSCRNDGCTSGIHPEDAGDGRFAAWIGTARASSAQRILAASAVLMQSHTAIPASTEVLSALLVNLSCDCFMSLVSCGPAARAAVSLCLCNTSRLPLPSPVGRSMWHNLLKLYLGNNIGAKGLLPHARYLPGRPDLRHGWDANSKTCLAGN